MKPMQPPYDALYAATDTFALGHVVDNVDDVYRGDNDKPKFRVKFIDKELKMYLHKTLRIDTENLFDTYEEAFKFLSDLAELCKKLGQILFYSVHYDTDDIDFSYSLRVHPVRMGGEPVRGRFYIAFHDSNNDFYRIGLFEDEAKANEALLLLDRVIGNDYYQEPVIGLTALNSLDEEDREIFNKLCLTPPNPKDQYND